MFLSELFMKTQICLIFHSPSCLPELVLENPFKLRSKLNDSSTLALNLTLELNQLQTPNPTQSYIKLPQPCIRYHHPPDEP